LAEGARRGRERFSCFHIFAYNVYRCTLALRAPSGDNCVHLCVDAPAEFITLSRGDLEMFPFADRTIAAVGFSSRRACVAGSYYLVVLYNHGSVISTETGSPFENRGSDVEIVVFLGWPVHGSFPLFKI